MIEAIAHPPREQDVDQLAELLVDAVDAGASVSFLPPLSLQQARLFWRDALTKADPRAIFLVGRDDAGIAGTVQVHPAWAPNQPHRAEVSKLIVHRRARQRGLGGALMEMAEESAAAAGFTLLTLDTKRGDVAEGFYRRHGWTFVGIIPGYALNADRSPCDTVFFYKSLVVTKRVTAAP